MTNRKLLVQSELYDIVEKVERNERLGREDGIRMMKSRDILTIGYMADLMRQRKVGDNVYFISNRHINHTNICKVRCKLCAFGKDEGDKGSYLLSLDQVVEKAREVRNSHISEIHIVGGCHPDLRLDYTEEMLRRVSETLPGVHIQAFTAVEIDHFAETEGLSLKEVLTRLKNAGLGSLPGGGAEIFAPRVRQIICEKKISGERWLEVHGTAHTIGIPTNATLLYGHVETMEERVDHLLALREQQEKTHGFLAFIPLAWHPQNTQLVRDGLPLKGPTGFDDIKVHAIARLLLDNFNYIKGYWIMQGPKMAQILLAFGVNDLDGTVMEEHITKDAGGKAGQAMTKADLVRLIKMAGRRPVERDTLYNVVEEVF